MGRFPELVNFREKRIWLNSLYNRIFFNDLIVRHKIKNEDAPASVCASFGRKRDATLLVEQIEQLG